MSPHYRDQFRYWPEGRALPLAGKPVKGGPQLGTGGGEVGSAGRRAAMSPVRLGDPAEERRILLLGAKPGDGNREGIRYGGHGEPGQTQGGAGRQVGARKGTATR